MERHLRSIPAPTELDIVTINQLAGEYGDGIAIDESLQRRFGSAVYYIAAGRFYGINEDDTCADPIVNDGELGVFAYYSGVRRVLVNKRNDVTARLAAVESGERMLACFTTIDATVQRDKRLQNYDVSIGSLLPRIGVDFDTVISIKSLHEVIAGIADEVDYSQTSRLRSV